VLKGVNHDALTQQEDEDVVNTVANNLGNGFAGSRPSCSESRNGEIDPLTVSKLLRSLHPPLTSDDVLYDLGSGRGLVPSLAYFEFSVHKAVGVELMPSRAVVACDAIRMLESILPNSTMHSAAGARGPLQYRTGNMLHQAMDDASVIFICATCFRHALMREVLLKVLEITARSRKSIRVLSYSQHFITSKERCISQVTGEYKPCTTSEDRAITELPPDLVRRVVDCGHSMVDSTWSVGSPMFLTLVNPPQTPAPPAAVATISSKPPGATELLCQIEMP